MGTQIARSAALTFLPDSTHMSRQSYSAHPFSLLLETTAGIPFTTLSQVLPFILIGIGVDDMVRF